MEDSFIKDLRFVLEHTAPAGAGVVDLRNSIGARPFLKNYARIGIARTVKYSWLGPRRTWYRSHVESRMLGAFNEPGRERLYRAVAQLLRRNPSAGGCVSTSWFNDPKIWAVSPRLAYLSRIPSRNGAFLICDGQAEIHTRRALEKSPTRQRLYEEGKYQPMCFTVVWPRKALLSWDDRNPAAAQDRG